ncbi:uncharacterized protein PV06_05819 [Exophiala oligosperma]|uniref:Helix-turn-helix domain-containing protein n=2 Tax=Chaetothyriales TaxID=34395 RepID=A0A0D2DII3_9EURO|nr:uncharacterized protein PV06_05819 [Exophiala oligosperma]KAJ9622105.1 hypothetical protein H2204_011686 [Knufia peltigerae]KIW42255.1 hypothetical protein PV06_05819 [Exophiala oligosperma]
MGNSSSKVASKAAAGAARRQYPSTSSIANSAATAPSRNNAPPTTSSKPTTTSPQVHPNPATSPAVDERTQNIELDGRDPQFGSRLQRIGPVKLPSGVRPEEAFPTSSEPMQPAHNLFPSTQNNPAVILTQARQRINKQWEFEVENGGRPSFPGRTLLNSKDIKEALRLRDEMGKTSQDVEKQMKLKPGILDQLVAKGMVANA